MKLNRTLALLLLLLFCTNCRDMEIYQGGESNNYFEGEIIAIYREYSTDEAGNKLFLVEKDKYTIYIKEDKIALIQEDLPNRELTDSLTKSRLNKPLTPTLLIKRKRIIDHRAGQHYSFYMNPDEFVKSPFLSDAISVEDRYSIRKTPYQKTPLLDNINIRNLGRDSTLLGYKCQPYEIITPVPEYPDLTQKVWINPSIKVKDFPHIYRALNVRNGDLNNTWMLDNGFCMYMEADVLSKGHPLPINNVLTWQVVSVEATEVSESIFTVPTKFEDGQWK